MTLHKMEKDEQVEPGEKWVTVTHAISGHFAVVMWMNNEEPNTGPFAEPYDTGLGRYRTKEEAEKEALWIAEEFDIPYHF